MQKNKITSIVLGLVVVGLAATIAYNQPRGGYGKKPATDSQTTSSTTPSTTTTSSGTYTLAQIATHNGPTSCWTTVNGGVYDVTAWITQHPGGENPILSLCGKDGSAAFNGQHGGQARPANELASFKIGALTQ